MSLVSASIVGFDLDFVRHAMRLLAPDDGAVLKVCGNEAVPRDALADAA